MVFMFAKGRLLDRWRAPNVVEVEMSADKVEEGRGRWSCESKGALNTMVQVKDPES